MSYNIITMAEELKDLLYEYGREVFLRQPTAQKCNCFDDSYDTGDRECPHCNGFGYVYTDRKVLAYRWTTTENISGAYRRPPAEYGFSSTDESTFFFEKKTQSFNPTSQCWIIECKTKDNGCMWQPYKIEQAWSINHVVPFRDKSGAFSYFSVRCRRVVLGK